jgi:hypothetical protein
MIKSKVIAIAFLTASTLAVCSSVFSQENASYSAEIQARKSWRETIGYTVPPKTGACYHASYPSTVWKEVACVTAPNRPFAHWLPNAKKIESMKAAENEQAQTVGDSVDYIAKVPGLMDLAIGQFSAISGVTSETGYDGANDYSLQLNSNFMSSPACNGHSGCLAWQQYVYSSGEQALFIQYWLLDYGTCPSGWNTYGSDCWKNSSAVQVPTIPVTELINVDLWGGAASANDSIRLTTGSYYPSAGVDSYSFTTPNSVLDLVAGWDESEFNVFGDGGGSVATFNSGSSIGVRIQLLEQGSTQTAPTCVANAGTTGETNNLTLGACTTGVGVAGSTNPYVSFTESN